jgi:hypothetical protein
MRCNDARMERNQTILHLVDGRQVSVAAEIDATAERLASPPDFVNEHAAWTAFERFNERGEPGKVYVNIACVAWLRPASTAMVQSDGPAPASR